MSAKKEEKRLREIDEFSESFYGPVYSEFGEVVETDETVQVIEKRKAVPGYHFVNETHVDTK